MKSQVFSPSISIFIHWLSRPVFSFLNVQASRESISRLADFTEQADIDTKRQLEELRTEIACEKIKAK